MAVLLSVPCITAISHSHPPSSVYLPHTEYSAQLMSFTNCYSIKPSCITRQ